MTESEWLTCTDPTSMLEFLQGKVSNRKLRLFACACCRRFWALLEIPERRAAIRAAERYADGLVYDRRRMKVMAALEDDDDMFSTAHLLSPDAHYAAYWTIRGFCSASAWTASDAEGDGGEKAKCLERVAQADLLRCIFGNPSRPFSLASTWLTQTVSELAAAAYEERFLPSGELDSEQLFVLADALEEVGCTDAEILDHLRSPGPHVRGCWCVDLSLAKT